MPRPEVSLLVLSPHLDDAALSCGGLLTGLAGGVRATVATFFTEAGPEPVLTTRSASAFLALAAAQGAPARPGELCAARRAEDRAALAPWAEVVHVGMVDGVFRRRGLPLPAAVVRRLPELDHVYPTYRFGLARGRVARADRGTVQEVRDWVARWLADHGDGWVLAPLGIGGHVDHVLVRTAACDAVRADRLVFYADLPYALTGAPDPGFLRRRSLTAVRYQAGARRKRELVLRYATQAGALYPRGVPETDDEFWVGPATDGRALLERLTT